MPIMFHCLVYHKIRNKKRCISKLKKADTTFAPLAAGDKQRQCKQRKGCDGMDKKTMMTAGAVTAAMAVAAGAAGMAASNKNSRKMKKVAKKVSKGAQRAVLDFDKMVSRYYR